MTVSYFGLNQDRAAEIYREKLVDSPPEAIAIDVETISLKNRLPLGFAIAVSPDDAFYFQVHPTPPS